MESMWRLAATRSPLFLSLVCCLFSCLLTIVIGVTFGKLQIRGVLIHHIHWTHKRHAYALIEICALLKYIKLSF